VWTTIRCRGQRLDRRLEPGDVVGIRYGAWRVVEVRIRADVDLTDEDREHMLRFKPEFREQHRPYAVVLTHVAGPNLMSRRGRIHLEGSRRDWMLLGERHAVCSCHGHPWPCQDADRDRVAAMQAAALEQKLAKAIPGVCPACGQPITTRQRSVLYPGENLDVPGGPEPCYHTRGACWSDAVAYELRWIAADPRRERILTWPNCPGMSIVHADGTDECHAMAGAPAPSPDCRGHQTHDHMCYSACLSTYQGGCPRGCRREDHRGTGALRRRPDRRDQGARP
jgi:hypothetical protein